MKMKRVSFAVLCVVAALVVFLCETRTAEAVTCNVSQLSPCLSAFSGSPPTAACCTKLKEQKPCLCGYLKNPSLQPYINNPNAKKLASACGVEYPKC